MIAREKFSSDPLIYGCMQIGGSWDESPLTDDNRQKAFHTLGTALECGFTFFDHADIYCRGKSELVFGEFLRTADAPSRDSLIIQSKVGIFNPGYGIDNPIGRFDFSRKHILSSVDAILQRLGIDYLDILLFHRPDMLTEGEEFGSAVDELYSSGKVRHFGVSNHSPQRLAWLQSFCDRKLEFNQLEFSLNHRLLIESEIHWNQNNGFSASAAGAGLDTFRINDVGIQAWSPMARGRFSGGASAQDEQAQPAAAYVRELAESMNCSPEAVVLAWILRIPVGIQPVIGTTNPDRIRACAQSRDVSLTREQWYRLMVLARGEVMP